MQGRRKEGEGRGKEVGKDRQKDKGLRKNHPSDANILDQLEHPPADPYVNFPGPACSFSHSALKAAPLF